MRLMSVILLVAVLSCEASLVAELFVAESLRRDVLGLADDADLRDFLAFSSSTSMAIAGLPLSRSTLITISLISTFSSSIN